MRQVFDADSGVNVGFRCDATIVSAGKVQRCNGLAIYYDEETERVLCEACKRNQAPPSCLETS